MNAHTPAPWQNPNTTRRAFTRSPEFEKRVADRLSDYLAVEFCQSVRERLSNIARHLYETGPDNSQIDMMTAEVLLRELAEDIGQVLDETREKPGPAANG